MKKLPLILICLGLLFVSANFAQKKSSAKTRKSVSANKKTQTATKRKEKFVCDLPARVNSVELSQTEVILNCSAGNNSCSNNKIIKVRTTALASDEDKYVYSISAGKIIGEGENIEWDLTDVKPGTYTITAGISQYLPDWGWAVFGETKTQVVTIKECPDCKE